MIRSLQGYMYSEDINDHGRLAGSILQRTKHGRSSDHAPLSLLLQHLFTSAHEA